MKIFNPFPLILCESLGFFNKILSEITSCNYLCANWVTLRFVLLKIIIQKIINLFRNTMYKFYFSLISFFTFSLILTGCYFNWEDNYSRFSFKIFKDLGLDFAFDSYMSKFDLETEVFGQSKLITNIRPIKIRTSFFLVIDITKFINHNLGHESLFGRSRNDTNQESLLENSEEIERQEEFSGEILDLDTDFLTTKGKFFNTFRFPLNLNPKGFRLGMKVKYRTISSPIKIIFMGRDLRNLLNIIIKGCRIYLFSKDNKNSGFFYDSSPLFVSKNSSEELQLIMDWTESTFRISAVRSDNSQVALGSIVKTDSPLVAFGSAYVGETLNPLQIEWNFKNEPKNARFECLIGYFEERCKSNSIKIVHTLDKNFTGIKADGGFLKVAFQFPPKEKLPVILRMMKGKEPVVSIQFSLDQMVINETGKSLKHFFLNKYQEGEWLNMDLIPISNLSLSYLIFILKTACSRRVFGLKNTSSCLESIREENNPTKEYKNQDRTKGSCKNEFLQNIARSEKILGRGYDVPESQEFETFNSSSVFKLLMAIDEEIIGKLENLVFLPLFTII